MNDLDRAIMALQRSVASTPEFYRQMTRGELWFLLPFHPEMEGADFQIQNGTVLPFSRLADAKGEVVPIFSSEARLEEGLKAGHVPPNTYLCGKMPALHVLDVLGSAGLRAVLNKSCATGELTLPPDLMRALADGSAFQPVGDIIPRQARLAVIDPADYPTNLIQPVFEFLRRHAAFRAAWVLQNGPAAAAPERVYQLLFLMTPPNQTLFHDLNLVVQAACGQEFNVELGLLDEAHTAHTEQLFQQAAPFFMAVDYQRPPRENAPGPAKQPAKSRKAAWPKALPARVKAVERALDRAGGPATATALAQQFARVQPEEVAEILEILVALGRAQHNGNEFTRGK